MTRVLCVDLGTSSIRAGLREPGRMNSRALEIGEAFKSSIDRASIPSAVFVPPDGSSIVFGEEALVMGRRGEKSLLFETSPKGWMTTGTPEELESEVVKGSGVTRKILLAGLLAQAFSATRKAANLSKKDLAGMEIRVAHPVWDAKRAKSLGDALGSISSAAIGAEGVTDRAVTPADLVDAIEDSHPKGRQASIDVVEPVAAALELFENSDNAREFCLVIDVGAGTTDLALFLSLTPDKAGYRRKFVQAAAPRSMYEAGDVIDKEVIQLILSRAKRVGGDDLRSLTLRRREIKERLLSKGKVFEVGVEVTASELERRERIREMCSGLAGHFHALLSDAERFMSTFLTTGFHRVNALNVVFAGGGGSINFLHRAIGTSLTSSGRKLPISIRKDAEGARELPASMGRLAVALGGTVPAQYWPVTNLEPGEWARRN
jgi:hypothetical protein